MSAVWLLDIDYAGKPLRFASRRVTVPSRVQGGDVTYEPTLDPALTVPLGAESVTVQVNIPGGVAATRAAHGPLRGRPAVLRLWRSEPFLEDARVVVAGRVAGASWGAPGSEDGVCDLEIGQGAHDASNAMLKPSGVVDRAGWPGADDKAVGRMAPMVFGRPGGVGDDGGNTAAFPGSPGIIVNVTGLNKRLLLAGHHVNVGTVTIFDITDGKVQWTGVVTVTNNLDSTGQECATCLVPLASSPAENADMYAAWTDASGVRFDGRTARGLGTVLLMAAANSPTLHDTGRMRSELPALDRMLVDAVVNDPDITWDEWLDSILPGFGVVRVNGPAGRFYREARYRPDPLAVRCTLVVDGGGGFTVEKSGPETEEDVGPATTVRMMYGMNASSGEMSRWVSMAAEANPNDQRVTPHPACRQARDLYERYNVPITATGYLATADYGTAVERARLMADVACVPGSMVVYVGTDALGASLSEYDTVEVVEGGVSRLGLVQPGMVVGEFTTEVTVRFA